MAASIISRIGAAVSAVAVTVSTLAALTVAPPPAVADSRVHFGLNVGIPLYPWGGPYYRHYDRPPNIYYPPPVVYMPTPAYPQPVYPQVMAPQVQAQPPGQAYCREYQSKVNIAGKSQPTYGTACRQPDGTWRIIN